MEPLNPRPHGLHTGLSSYEWFVTPGEKQLGVTVPRAAHHIGQVD